MINVLDPIFDKKTIGKSFLQHRFKIGVAIISNEMWEAVSNSKLKKDTLSKLTHPIAGGDDASIYRQQEIFEKLKNSAVKLHFIRVQSVLKLVHVQQLLFIKHIKRGQQVFLYRK